MNKPKFTIKPQDQVATISDMKVEKVDAELVLDDTKLVSEPSKRKKHVKMTLDATEHYVKKFMNMPPKKVMEFIEAQTNTLMIYSKNAALEFLAEAQETGSSEAMDRYLQVIQASAVLAQEKASLQKIFGIDVESKPRQYKAPDMTKDEWEATYKPGQPAPKEIAPQEEIYNGPAPKSVN